MRAAVPRAPPSRLMLLCQLGVGQLGARAVAFLGHRELAQGNLSRRPGKAAAHDDDELTKRN